MNLDHGAEGAYNLR